MGGAGDPMTEKEIIAQELEEAVTRAINQVGFERFKNTSMFMSSQRRIELKKAA